MDVAAGIGVGAKPDVICRAAAAGSLAGDAEPDYGPTEPDYRTGPRREAHERSRRRSQPHGRAGRDARAGRGGR